MTLLVYSQKFNNMEIFIQSAAQISIQNPLCEDWFENPIIPTLPYNRSIEPDYKQFISPIASRRMGKLIKRAIATSLSALKQAEIQELDAIITGTGLGCVENTEKFLSAMVKEGEEFLQPTFFMQSTHNTISSQVALFLKCNGYNCTYSHRGTSFESALSDAFIQMKLGKIKNALVSGQDEMTPDYFNMLGKIGYWKNEISTDILRNSNTNGSFAGECSAAITLATEPKEQSLCKLQNVELLYKPSKERMQQAITNLMEQANISSIDAIMLGLSGDKQNDDIYKEFALTFFADKPICWYKNIFGESFTAPSFGVYTAATCLKRGIVPQHLCYNGQNIQDIRTILVYNHFQNKDHSLILLSKC